MLGLSSKQIAAMYRVSEPTMSRWLAAARRAVLEQTQRLLHERLRLSPDEVRSLAGVVYSLLDLSLSRSTASEMLTLLFGFIEEVVAAVRDSG